MMTSSELDVQILLYVSLKLNGQYIEFIWIYMNVNEFIWTCMNLIYYTCWIILYLPCWKSPALPKGKTGEPSCCFQECSKADLWLTSPEVWTRKKVAENPGKSSYFQGNLGFPWNIIPFGQIYLWVSLSYVFDFVYLFLSQVHTYIHDIYTYMMYIYIYHGPWKSKQTHSIWYTFWNPQRL